MKNYPINHIPRNVLEFSKTEYEGFINAMEEKTESVYQSNAMDQLIMDYSNFETVRRLTEENLKEFRSRSEQHHEEIQKVKGSLALLEDQMKYFQKTREKVEFSPEVKKNENN